VHELFVVLTKSKSNNIKQAKKTMKFSSNIAILFINAYGANAFTLSPTNNVRGITYTKSATGTQLFYLKDETTVPTIALNNDIIPTNVAKKIEHPLTTQKGNMENISYDAIQDLIDVSRPYYNLKDETIITDLTTGTFNGFAATVTPEMPLSYESGYMTAAEAGRHTAIAGSVAASLLNKEAGTKGKHYYLALDANLIQEPVDSNILKSFSEVAPPVKKGDARVFAYATDVNKRDATAEVYLLTDDNTMWHITVTYKIIPFKVFDRFFPLSVDPSLTGPWDPSSIPNPYKKGITTHITPQPLAHWNDPAVYQCKSHLPPAIPSMCAGHFDTNPCFPVAFMCSHLFNIGAESVAELAAVSLPYTKRNGDDNNERNSVTIKELVFDAQTLVMAGTYRLDVDCTTKYNPDHKDGPVYETVLKATSDCAEKHDVATVTVTYAVNKETV
jgi:hypothetical protein